MNKNKIKDLIISIILLTVFTLWTISVCFVDVKAIGHNGSNVGLSSMNNHIHKMIGVHLQLYYITDWLGLVPIIFAFGFTILGTIQWIKRKRLKKVDYSILVLGVFYTVVIVSYILFEIICINYRPVLIDGKLETSYPSSTTLLVACIMPTTLMQFNKRIKNVSHKKFLSFSIVIFIVFMVIGRLISGVHWFSDIIGGLLLSAGFVMLYRYFVNLKEQ